MDPSRPSDFERENLPHQLHRMRQARTVLLAVGSVTVLLGLLIASKPVILAGVGPIVLGLLVGLAVRAYRSDERDGGRP